MSAAECAYLCRLSIPAHRTTTVGILVPRRIFWVYELALCPPKPFGFCVVSLFSGCCPGVGDLIPEEHSDPRTLDPAGAPRPNDAAQVGSDFWRGLGMVPTPPEPELQEYWFQWDMGKLLIFSRRTQTQPNPTQTQTQISSRHLLLSCGG